MPLLCLVLLLIAFFLNVLKEENTRIIELAMYESDARKVVCEVRMNVSQEIHPGTMMCI